jgi:hypothetical protein
LVTGEYQPHLESALLEEVRALKSRGPLTPVVIIVPTNALGRHLSRYLGDELGGHAEIRFLTLLDLSKRLAERHLATEGISPMPPLADQLLLRESIEETTAEGNASYFERVAGSDGFLRVLLAAMNDLREGRLTPKDLESAAGQAPLSRVATGKILEVVRLWRSFEKRKGAAGLYDRSDLMARAASSIEKDEWIAGLPGIIFYGFYDLNPLQKQMVDGCAAVLDTVFMFPYVDGVDFDYARPTLDWLIERGFEAESAGSKRAAKPDLRVLSAAGEERECVEIVREILKLGGLGEKKDGAVESLRLSEVGVLLREPMRYAGPLTRTFDDLGVEANSGEGLPLCRTRAGRSIALFMELIESDFSRREVMDFLTFAELDQEDRERESEDTALWDLLSKEAGIVMGIRDWRRKLAAMSGRGWSPRTSAVDEEAGSRPESRDIAKTLLETVERLHEAISSLRSKGKPSQLAEGLCAAFTSLLAPGEGRDAVTETILGLSSLDSCAGSMERSSFFWLVRRQLDATQERRRSAWGRGPTVAGLMTSRGLPFRVVVIPGLVEGSFPSPVRQDPILLDRERASLNAAFEEMGLDGRLSFKSERSKEERLLFALARTSASERTLLTFSRIDPLTGSERLPSEYLLETVASETGERCDPAALDKAPFYNRVPLDRHYPEDGSFLSVAEFDLMAAAGAVGGDRGALDYLKGGEGFLRHSMEAESQRWGQSRFTVYDGVMENPEALKLLKKKSAGSGGVMFPTSLETYAACPFQYFMGHILGVESIEAPEDVLSMAPMDKGRLAHSILEKLYADAFEKGGGPAAGWAEKLDSIASKMLERFRADNPFGLPLLWDIDESKLKDDLHAAVAQDLSELGDFVPWKLELKFGYGRRSGDERGDPSETAAELPLPGGRVVLLGGKIDRVDLDKSAGTARVIDYKTGKGTGYKEDRLGGGTALQLPLYILGAQRLLGEGARVVDAQYYLVSGENLGGRIHFTGDALRERMPDLLVSVETIVNGMENGVFFSYPGDACRYCDYRSACGQGLDLFDRKSADPRVQDFLRMKELE